MTQPTKLRGPDEDRMLTPLEACTLPESPVRGLVGRDAMYSLIKDGLIDSVKVGRRIFVRMSALRAWLDRGAPLHSTNDNAK